MSKLKFLMQLRKALMGLPQADIEDRLTFYSEIIDDRIEEGLSEEEAISSIGSVDEIVAQIISDIPLGKLVKEKLKPKKVLRVWEIVLLVLGSPIWLSILICLFAVILLLYILLWSVIISLWAVFASLTACFLGGGVSGIVFAINSNCLAGVAILGAAIVCLGLSIFLFYGCKVATKGILILTKKIAVWIKNCFIKKEEA